MQAMDDGEVVRTRTLAPVTYLSTSPLPHPPHAYTHMLSPHSLQCTS